MIYTWEEKDIVPGLVVRWKNGGFAVLSHRGLNPETFEFRWDLINLPSGYTHWQNMSKKFSTYILNNYRAIPAKWSDIDG